MTRLRFAWPAAWGESPWKRALRRRSSVLLGIQLLCASATLYLSTSRSCVERVLTIVAVASVVAAGRVGVRAGGDVLIFKSYDVHGEWVAHDLVTEVVTQGRSRHHAVAMLGEALTLLAEPRRASEGRAVTDDDLGDAS